MLPSMAMVSLRNLSSSVPVALSSTGNTISRDSTGIFPEGFRLRRRAVVVRGRLNATGLQTVENGQIRTGVEIPVTCYQILGVADQAEKDEIVKSVMDLKSAVIEEGYTMDVVVSRQDLLMDVRDKLLFEPEYAGNAREKIPPKSSLRIPWAWLPGALCLLQEVGEEKLVLEIGQAALHHQDAKPYIHDLLLSMALAECAIAKIGFEKNKVSQGFEALARAQYLLRSKISLGKMPLLSQIEESLEELAPACTLEILAMPHTPENAERRRGAIAALRELLRQGLDVETSCRVQDWPCFFSQSLNRLMATEIVDLLPWDELAITRKNKKSLESQNQRVVIDFNCFYMAMIAHIALGFSSKQRDLITKAKAICECLVASEGIDLKIEEALCSFLLGQVDMAEAVERLEEYESNLSAASRNIVPTIGAKEVKNGSDMNLSLETWMKDAVLGVFPDTQDCSPSLVNFFGGENKSHKGNKKNKGTPQTMSNLGSRSVTFVSPTDNRACVEPLSHLNSTRNLGLAVKQLAPPNLQNLFTVSKMSDGNSAITQSLQLKRNLGSHHNKVWESWWALGDTVGRITIATIIGCVVFTTCKLLGMQFGKMRNVSTWNSGKPKMDKSIISWSIDPSLDYNPGPACIDGSNISGRLRKLLVFLKKQMNYLQDAQILQNSWPSDDRSPLNKDLNKKSMPVEEAEALVQEWQTIKAEALGPGYQVHGLSEILADSMLAQWQALAESAKARSCFWRFVLLKLSVSQAEIVSNGTSGEIAEIEAMVEEAAELVDESQPKNPTYYSTYKIRYLLKRQYDGSWRFCEGSILSPT
uniref:Plastid division protein CDP1, chloroplastic n=1 Tax=Nelumbo nucifera TaxID=4432 RepID=A0A822YRE3_NELNU|nr:TPA_asm: hypothetical protein HUJ06_012810 [Nelumbo nucifera]